MKFKSYTKLNTLVLWVELASISQKSLFSVKWPIKFLHPKEQKPMDKENLELRNMIISKNTTQIKFKESYLQNRIHRTLTKQNKLKKTTNS